jgi:protein TonB
MFTLRVPFAAASGVLISLAVFLGLWQLVGARFDAEPPTEAVTIQFTRQITPTPVEIKRQEKVDRPPPTLTPKGPPGVITDTFVDPATPFVRHIVDRGPRTGALPVSGVDRDSLPIVRVPPQYPPSAITRQIEGWVQVQFTVAASGSVRDAVVVASEPRGVFDEAALAAIARWRYNPRIQGGVATERVGLQTVLRFELENQR